MEIKEQKKLELHKELSDIIAQVESMALSTERSDKSIL